MYIKSDKIVKFLILVIMLFTTVLTKSKEEWKTRIIYQLLTDRFARTNGDSSGCDVHNYCGGSFRGIMNNLDYITGMGFNAIWISPVLENTPGSYHGYHMTNLYAINSNFGSEQDLKDLVAACHAKDVWVMVDVVANHSGPVGTDYGRVHPFNDAAHYHDYCVISGDDFAHNQNRVEV
jgi:alpha-amylase